MGNIDEKTLDKPTAKLNNLDCSKETAPVSGQSFP